MKKIEATQKTTATLLEIARSHFTIQGYYDASLEKIAEEGNVTRGAVYHHFQNKKGLFLAVLDMVQKDVARQIEREALQSEDPWQQLILGCLGFIKGVNGKECRRILLVDAPAVAGWEAWRRADRENSADVLQKHIGDLKELGYLADHVNTHLMTLSISGALNELALDYPTDEGKETDQALCLTIAQLVEGFRKKAS